MHLSRFYRVRDGESPAPRGGPIGGDLGYLKYGVFVGDNRTFSVTLATPTADDELRKLVSAPAVFDACARPDAMVKDADVFGRVLAVWQDRDNRPPEPLLGRPRALNFSPP